jgi:hypothetical protein
MRYFGCTLLSGNDTVPASQIFFLGNGFKVVWVYAGRIAAKVV